MRFQTTHYPFLREKFEFELIFIALKRVSDLNLFLLAKLPFNLFYNKNNNTIKEYLRKTIVSLNMLKVVYKTT